MKSTCERCQMPRDTSYQDFNGRRIPVCDSCWKQLCGHDRESQCKRIRFNALIDELRLWKKYPQSVSGINHRDVYDCGEDDFVGFMVGAQ